MRLSFPLSLACAVVGTSLACGQPPLKTSPATCDVAPVLEVHNKTSYEIEVVEMRSNTAAGPAVAFLRPGIHTVTIETNRPAQYAARYAGARAWITWEGGRRGRDQVTLERRCP